MEFARDAAIEAFRDYAIEDLSTLPPEEGFVRLLDFYDQVAANGAAPAEEDGDMLLFQFGTYEWFGNPRRFELSLTRQVIYPDGEDQEIWQLRLTYFYEPAPALDSLKGNEWCHEREGLEGFRTAILASPALVACSKLEIVDVALNWEQQ